MGLRPPDGQARDDDGAPVTTFVTADDVPTTPADVDRLLAADGSITHVGLIHCETSTGIHNPLEAIAESWRATGVAC